MTQTIFDGLDKGEIICWMAEETTGKVLINLRKLEQQMLALAAKQSVTLVPDAQLRVNLNRVSMLREIIETFESVSK